MNGAEQTYDQFYNRDLSWLSFNERVLMEAAKESVPLFERIKFLSIYSSNLDEFYRVRMPVMMALHKINYQADSADEENGSVVKQANEIIGNQLQQFGATLRNILPQLQANGIELIFGKRWPIEVEAQVLDYFYSQVLSFLQPVDLYTKGFFPENNKLYHLVSLRNKEQNTRLVVLNIPSDHLPRFFSVTPEDGQVILFIDDIIRYNLEHIFTDEKVLGCYSFKITRDAEIDLEGEYPGDLAEQIEKQLLKRDSGYATRFLYEAGIPLRILELLIQKFDLEHAGVVEGGIYHNLKDLASLPVKAASLEYEPWPGIQPPKINLYQPLLDQIAAQNIIIHAPYHSYATVLRFFNEAALNPDVKEIYTTLYRVAHDSRIVNALISAAKNGKKVQVLVELKARFDEENNIRWAKQLKKAGVDILYSSTKLKVHAKVALVKFRKHERVHYRGLLATGNLNESTARFYTDHILMTAHPGILRELELLFIFLHKRKRPGNEDSITFEHLLVAQFNLQQQLLALIEREIGFARQGLAASIIIKINNLEEQKLIAKLYDASRAGVKVCLIVRSICCLMPGVKGMSDNITVKRIVDRYLEHGRVFIFHNNGQNNVYLGSADWMNRNIYHRIEVCFPVYDAAIRQEILNIIDLQLKDNTEAVKLNSKLENVVLEPGKTPIRSQKEIYELLRQQSQLNIMEHHENI